jgi:LytS/YehU family sensor histidine kinase
MDIAESPSLVTRPTAARSNAGAWFAYVAAWAAAAGLWSLAGASSARVSPLSALPYGVMTMTVAGLMGVGVWRLTAFLPWRSSRHAFYGLHAVAIVTYSCLYTLCLVLPDLARGQFAIGLVALRDSPVLFWNLLMGSWLYLVIAGLSYAIRGERARERDRAATAEAMIVARNAQLSALRAQLNPHFLFNALHTVSALITSDPGAADRAIERLGDLLRYAMAEDEVVSLSAEWQFVRDYLAFEQLRLGDRLDIDAHLDPAAGDCLVPPLLLQPLVENAVRHGIAWRAEGGRISLDARRSTNGIRVRVADDGPGNGSREHGRRGRGLDLVRRRLHAAFGDDAELRIDATHDPPGYAVAVTIPERTR